MGGLPILLGALCAVAAAITIALQLAEIQRQRRLLLDDRARRQFLIRGARDGMKTVVTPPARLASAQPSPQPAVVPIAASGSEARAADDNGAGDAPPRRPAAAQEGIIYIDADGHCTFINEAARQLLAWNDGNLALGDILAGGAAECAAFIAALKRQGLIEQHLTTLANADATPLELSAVALRDRDDNLWGAALFVRRLPVASDNTPEGDGKT